MAFEEGGDGGFEESVAVGLAGEGSARVDYTFVDEMLAFMFD